MITAADIANFLNTQQYNQPTQLCELMEKHKSDKSLLKGWHNYTTIYDFLFKNLQNESINLFEVGIFHGYSLWAWKEYFPNGNIYAGDIRTETFINEDRISSFYCDQRNPSVLSEMWNNDQLKDIMFDIIIDDGDHTFESNFSFLVNSIHKLKTGGIFVIEDILNHDVERFLPILENIKQDLSLHHIELIRLPFEPNKIDNNIIIIIK